MALAATAVTFSFPAATETVESILKANPQLTPKAVNAAILGYPDQLVTAGPAQASLGDALSVPFVATPSAAITRLQSLLDRARASPCASSMVSTAATFARRSQDSS